MFDPEQLHKRPVNREMNALTLMGYRQFTRHAPKKTKAVLEVVCPGRLP